MQTQENIMSAYNTLKRKLIAKYFDNIITALTHATNKILKLKCQGKNINGEIEQQLYLTAMLEAEKINVQSLKHLLYREEAKALCALLAGVENMSDDNLYDLTKIFMKNARFVKNHYLIMRDKALKLEKIYLMQIFELDKSNDNSPNIPVKFSTMSNQYYRHRWVIIYIALFMLGVMLIQANHLETKDSLNSYRI